MALWTGNLCFHPGLDWIFWGHEILYGNFKVHVSLWGDEDFKPSIMGHWEVFRPLKNGQLFRHRNRVSKYSGLYLGVAIFFGVLKDPLRPGVNTE